MFLALHLAISSQFFKVLLPTTLDYRNCILAGALLEKLSAGMCCDLSHPISQ